MPLCICPADKEEKVQEPAVERKKAAPTIAPVVKKALASSSPSTFQGFGNSKSQPAMEIDMNGDLNEQCREAIKAGDLATVNQLLQAGAKATYRDRTGNTLMHLAALFNRLEIVQVLLQHGASVWTLNPAKESPVDVAPPALGSRMAALQPKPE